MEAHPDIPPHVAVYPAQHNPDVAPRKESKAKSAYRGALVHIGTRLPRFAILPILALLFTAIMFIIVGPIFTASLKNNKENTSAIWRWCVLGPGQAVCNPQGDQPYVVPRGGAVLIRGRINSLDLQLSTAAFSSIISFLGDLNDGEDFLTLDESDTLTIFGAHDNVTFTGGSRSGRFNLDIAMGIKTPTFNYPFDQYSAPISFQAYISSSKPGVPDRYVPLIAEFSINLPAIQLTIEQAQQLGVFQSPITGASASIISASVSIRRSNTTRFFSIFLVIAMWALSAATFVYVLDLVYLKPRRVSTDDAAYVAALLFALPSIRSVQPGVPDMGASVDVLGFFWNMALTGVAGLLVLGGLTAQTVPKKCRQPSDRSFGSKVARKLRKGWSSVTRSGRSNSLRSQKTS